MSEDEDFIRAIVAAPGDDAPRLVYADWLDERGDPRGEYVRAEVVWAQHRQAFAGRLLKGAAARLDPVWVARISRPPVGVCIDRMPVKDRGPELKAALLDDVEARYDLRLPAEYRAFLLNYNGGRIVVTHKPSWRRNESRVLSFDRLLRSWKLPSYRNRVATFRRAEATDVRTIIHVLRHDYIRMANDDELDEVWTKFMPIARAPEPGSWDVFLGMSGQRAGRVYEWDYLAGACLDAMTKLAPSLGRFLHRCELQTTSAARARAN